MTNTRLVIEIFIRFYYKICSTKPRIATASGFLYIKNNHVGSILSGTCLPMFSINYTAIIVYSRLHVSDPLLPPCYSTIAERRPVDRTPSHLSPAAMLPLPLYSHKFPFSRQSTLVIRMLVVMASASNRHFDLANSGQRGLGGIYQ
jgi:hypothetical protein